MRIVMLSQMVPYLPCRDGFRLCGANLLRQYSRRHEVRLVAVQATESPEELHWSDPYCASTTFIGSSRALTPGWLEQRFAAWSPDLCHIEGPGLAAVAAGARRFAPVVLSIHDSLALRCREFAKYAPSMGARFVLRLKALLAHREARQWRRSVDRVVVFSGEDRAALHGAFPTDRVAVIPNGIDLDHWAHLPARFAGPIVFTGNMSWPPNVDAAKFFVAAVLPLVRREAPDAEFWIVGADPCSEVRALTAVAGVRVTGSVPDIRPFLQQAAVYVSPLRFGAGVKNKILESMAVGAPIVATSRSLTGSSAIDRRDYWLANEPVDFAAAVVRLLRDRELALRLSRNARLYVERDCGWQSVAQRFEALYEQLCNGSPKEVACP